MEKKVKYRIVGAVVLVGLIALTIPLLQSPHSTSTETAAVKAPPFPDQATQVTAIPQAITPPAEMTADQLNEQANTIEPPAAAANNATTPTPDQSAQKAPIVTPVQPIKNDEALNDKPVINETPNVSTSPQAIKKAVNTPQMSAEEMIKNMRPHIVDATPKTNKIMARSKQITRVARNEMSQRAWVVQLGSFKNHANALRLVDQLRVSGYKAFMLRSRGALGENTRVLVGPENKHTNAISVANRLNSELHLRGVVMSYKPLSLS